MRYPLHVYSKLMRNLIWGETMAATSSQTDLSKEPSPETEIGLEVNVAAALAYVLGFLTGIIFYLLEDENDHVRFHAAQSMVVFGGIVVAFIALSFIQIIAGFGTIVGALLGAIISLVSLVLWVGALVLWIYLIVQTYQNKDPRIPGAAGIADNLV
jgi:uncharacterized membrane protein